MARLQMREGEAVPAHAAAAVETAIAHRLKSAFVVEHVEDQRAIEQCAPGRESGVRALLAAARIADVASAIVRACRAACRSPSMPAAPIARCDALCHQHHNLHRAQLALRSVTWCSTICCR